MKTFTVICAAALVAAASAWAQPMPKGMKAAQIVLLGEIHDNPDHHARQAEFVGQIAPKALVFEMLTAKQAANATPEARRERDVLETAVGWANTGWPDFGMYYPVFAAAPAAAIYGGGVPRDDARQALKQGIATWFGEQAAAYGLSAPLPKEQQQEREKMQMEAHCDALPEAMLPVMVDGQRLRDAALARVAVQALQETGGPVAIILGNGHARKDWGVPSYIHRVRPDAMMFALGQTEEDDTADPAFDMVLSAPKTPREDPCKAFR